jgi:hypothetical protein
MSGAEALLGLAAAGLACVGATAAALTLIKVASTRLSSAALDDPATRAAAERVQGVRLREMFSPEIAWWVGASAILSLAFALLDFSLGFVLLYAAFIAGWLCGLRTATDWQARVERGERTGEGPPRARTRAWLGGHFLLVWLANFALLAAPAFPVYWLVDRVG